MGQREGIAGHADSGAWSERIDRAVQHRDCLRIRVFGERRALQSSLGLIARVVGHDFANESAIHDGARSH